jgi:energy-coupling factor transporter ATP-binding protein EcfA2
MCPAAAHSALHAVTDDGRMRSAVSYFGTTNHRRSAVRFGIRQADRFSHIYIIGKTGVGKSTLLEALARQDIEAGRGCAVIDPHGDLVERLAVHAKVVAPEKLKYLDAPDPSQPFGYNPVRRVREDLIPLAASGLLETFRKLWPDAWGVRMEHVLRNSLYALLERDDAALPDILRFYVNDGYRKTVVRQIKNKTVRQFWRTEFEKYHYRQRLDIVAPIQNKLGALLSDPVLHRIFVSPQEEISCRSIMDRSECLLVNVSKGRLGSDSSLVLGAVMLSTIALAAQSRAAGGERRPFFVYVDEFQSFTTLMLASMLPELRKYGMGLTLANQHLHQLDPAIRSAVLGNAGTLISFRVGAEDAPLLAQEFEPKIGMHDLLNLPNHAFYVKLMIDGAPKRSSYDSFKGMGESSRSRKGVPLKYSFTTVSNGWSDFDGRVIVFLGL